MSLSVWTDVDAYYNDLLLAADPVLEETLAVSAAEGLPEIQVSPAQGKLLMLLAKAQGAKRILEIGTLGGYSTIWLARALPPEGRLITLEFEAKHAAVAKSNIGRAGFASQVEIRIGMAADSLAQLATEGADPFDFIFIDADKQSYAEYFRWALQFARPGTVIIADNVVRDGKVVDANEPDEMVQGIRRFNEMLAATPNVSATAIQTVGSKGYDGFTMMVVA